MNATRGGAGRGRGRPPIKAGEESLVISIRLTADQRRKLAALGGAAWIRARIDAASESAQSRAPDGPFRR